MTRLIEPTRDLRSTPGFVYHATNVERAHDIAREGLLTHEAGEFTDQHEWPDGGTEERVYFSPRADVVWQFAPEEGRPAILRVPRAAVRLRSESYTGDVYTRERVPPEHIEVLTDAGWVPASTLES